MDFPVFEASTTAGPQGKWALAAGRSSGRHAAALDTDAGTGAPPKRGARSKLVLLGGALLAVLILGFVLVLPALAGGSTEEGSEQPSPAAATPSVAPTSASPSPVRPSASAAAGEYQEPYYPPPAKPTTEAPEEDWYDDGDWPEDTEGWDDDDWREWWEENY
ncbi:hypothetical protein SAMN05443668_105584 [Cryptosporangium aurantiacum]|uniref:Uncharacterized protein n=2 Tax=Cryptosporangium aurantiacum TaxID=134849 RepID=A0A1M7QYE8_9ACTN|nr:hypothetical protein SAMN05443668_105584 [Cryptosporangium aurantiacum]